MAKVTFAGNPVTLAGKEIKVGDKAPDFQVVGQDLKPRKLSEFSGKVRILSVFPSIDTPVCATQNRKFNQEAANLGDVEILAISNDLPFALKRFCGAEGIDKVTTVSDYQTTDFGLKYGFLMDGLRLLARGTVVIDKDDTVKYVEYVPEVTHEPNYDKAVEAAKSLI